MATDFNDNDLKNRIIEVENKLNHVEMLLTEASSKVVREAVDKCSGKSLCDCEEELEKFKQLIKCKAENKINKAIGLYMELIECTLENKLDKAIAKCRKNCYGNDDDKLRELLDELKRRISRLEGKCSVPRQFLRGFSSDHLDTDRQLGSKQRYSRKVRKKRLSWSKSI